MQRIDGRILYAPTDLINFMESEFVSWMDRFYILFRDLLQPDKPDESTKILQEHGNRHELQFLSHLREEKRDVCEIPEAAEDAVSLTLSALRDGREIIYQGTLALPPFQGRSDFLVRRNATTPAERSQFGDFFYEVWDTKLARKPKPYFLIQLCCYAEMLQHIQGVLPSQIAVVLGNSQIQSFRTQDYYYFYRALKEAFLRFQEIDFDPEHAPDWIDLPYFTRWRTHGEKLLEDRDSLVRVANIRRVQISKLAKSGITTMKGLANTELEFIPKMLPATLDTLKRQARLQVESTGLPRPKFELLPAENAKTSSLPVNGLTLIPPASAGDIWFDMEGYPHIEGGLEYLFGASHAQDGVLSFADWWAHNRIEEKAAFEGFLDWVYDRWLAHPNMHVYHYASYEVSAMRRLMGRHGTREEQLDELLRNNVFVDLYQIVRQSVAIGEPSYSIKYIEHLYMPPRSGAVAKATDSVVYYEKWLEAGEAADWQESSILREIREYNEQDCVSTYHLTNWLRQLQSQCGMTYAPRPSPFKHKDSKVASDTGEGREANSTVKQSRSSAGVSKAESRALMLAMLQEVPPQFSCQAITSQPCAHNESAMHGTHNEAEHWRLHQLLAWLLCFHEREDKPIWWERFARREMTEEQLIDDIDCLGGLRRDEHCRWGEKIDGKNVKAKLYEYRFNPEQDTKLHVGKEVVFCHDITREAEIVELDRNEGRICFRITPKFGEPPLQASVMPKELVGLRTIAESIFQVVSQWRQCGSLQGCINDYLHRRPPRFKSPIGNGRIADDGASADEIAKVIAGLDNSTLIIQGPPGSGKTYTAAHSIVHLLKSKLRIGITSNSHAAIEHLMIKVMEECNRQNVMTNAVKIGGDPEQTHSPIAWKKNGSEVFNANSSGYQLIGGTAYAFSHHLAAGSLDYLFVEEAGQVSVANLVGVSRSTRNLVLVGDQMQLEQPIKGAHPGESGASTLEYFLGNLSTIPPDLGIFLGTTRRMRPEVCEVVSSMVYENRLQAHEITSARSIILPSQRTYLTKASGIIFAPVLHEGNIQGSVEEVGVIKEILLELQRCQFQDEDKIRDLRLSDIIMVAPYNMQVRLLQHACPGVEVGSIDKFQGREAAVMILSMCTSDAASSRHGLEFIFSQNRLNVAISRAQCLAIVVGHPKLAQVNCNSIAQMKLVNFFCRIAQEGATQTIHPRPIPASTHAD